MADTVKKAKAPAKPRKPATKKAATDGAIITTMPTAAVLPSHEEISKLAKDFWAQRGYKDGYAEQDWLRAEQELRGKAS